MKPNQIYFLFPVLLAQYHSGKTNEVFRCFWRLQVSPFLMLLEDVSASCLCAGMGLANSTPATQYAWDEATQHCWGYDAGEWWVYVEARMAGCRLLSCCFMRFLKISFRFDSGDSFLVAFSSPGKTLLSRWTLAFEC